MVDRCAACRCRLPHNNKPLKEVDAMKQCIARERGKVNVEKVGGGGSWFCEYNETGNSPILGIQLHDEKGRKDEIRCASEVYSFLSLFFYSKVG